MCEYCNSKKVESWELKDEDMELNLLSATYSNGMMLISNGDEDLEIEFDFCPKCGTKIIR